MPTRRTERRGSSTSVFPCLLLVRPMRLSLVTSSHQPTRIRCPRWPRTPRQPHSTGSASNGTSIKRHRPRARLGCLEGCHLPQNEIVVSSGSHLIDITFDPSHRTRDSWRAVRTERMRNAFESSVTLSSKPPTPLFLIHAQHARAEFSRFRHLSPGRRSRSNEEPHERRFERHRDERSDSHPGHFTGR